MNLTKVFSAYAPVTFVLFLLNTLVFVFEQYILKTYDHAALESIVIQYGINVQNISNIFVWFSSAFMHAGFIHYIFNMLALIYFGKQIELTYNTQKTGLGSLYILVTYLFGILLSAAGTIAYIYLTHDYSVVVIGASGAIFAIFAFYEIIMRKNFSGFLIFFLVYHFLMIYVLGINVAWYAHLGGSLAVVVAYFIFFQKQN